MKKQNLPILAGVALIVVIVLFENRLASTGPQGYRPIDPCDQTYRAVCEAVDAHDCEALVDFYDAYMESARRWQEDGDYVKAGWFSRGALVAAEQLRACPGY